MLYLARTLHIEHDGILRNAVVETVCGIVNKIYQFGGEVPSMTLVDEVYLSSSPSLKILSEIKTNSRSRVNGNLYAYALNGKDELAVLD